MPARVAALDADLRRLGPGADAALPGDIATLCATVEQIEGVKFGAMLRRFIADDTQATDLLQGRKHLGQLDLIGFTVSLVPQCWQLRPWISSRMWWYTGNSK